MTFVHITRKTQSALKSLFGVMVGVMLFVILAHILFWALLMVCLFSLGYWIWWNWLAPRRSSNRSNTSSNSSHNSNHGNVAQNPTVAYWKEIRRGNWNDAEDF